MSNLNERRRKATFGSTMMRIAGVLLAITAVTVWATSFMFARYTTGGKADNNGRVAKFTVAAGLQTNEELLIDVSTGGDNGEYVVTLTNNSETAVRGDLELDFTEINTKYKDGTTPIVIIEAITAKVDGTAITVPAEAEEGSEPTTTTTIPLNNNKVLLKSVKDLAPGGTATVTINLGADGLSQAAIKALTEDMKGRSSAETNTDLELDFDVKAIFTQID